MPDIIINEPVHLIADVIIGRPGPRGLQGIQGVQGEQGIQGEKGDRGEQGIQGESAYNAGNLMIGESARLVPITNGFKIQVSPDSGATWQDSGTQFTA